MLGRTTTLAAALSAAVVFGGGAARAQDASVEGAIAVAESLSAAFRHAAQVATPSVVQIRSSHVVRRAVSDPRYDPFGWGFGPRRMQEFEQQGLGSGFIVDEQGHIITNNHVIADADRLLVMFTDGSMAEATLVGADPLTDVAVIRVDPAEASGVLVPATIGDSEKMQVGDWVIAVGSPLALDETVTAGIVSATGRRQGIIRQGRREGYEAFIQTDAAINPGNSGGPLVNLRGEVIGINTAIKSTSGGSVGLGFAIPTSLAKGIVEQLIESGRVRRGWLGARWTDFTAASAELLGMSGGTVRGALIQYVEPGGPGDAAGIEVNDIVLAVNGAPVEDAEALRMRIADIRPGERATLRVLREGREREGEAVLADQHEADAGLYAILRSFGVGFGEPTAEDLTRLRELPPELRRGGAVVTHVVAGSPGEVAGFEVGDIVLGINDLRVDSPETLGALLSKARPGMALQFTVSAPDGRVGTKVFRVPDRRYR